eukprot:scaffold3820_cov415-Prasinococcus_capsulatus_cf.AAC.8
MMMMPVDFFSSTRFIMKLPGATLARTVYCTGPAQRDDSSRTTCCRHARSLASSIRRPRLGRHRRRHGPPHKALVPSDGRPAPKAPRWWRARWTLPWRRPRRRTVHRGASVARRDASLSSTRRAAADSGTAACSPWAGRAAWRTGCRAGRTWARRWWAVGLVATPTIERYEAGCLEAAERALPPTLVHGAPAELGRLLAQITSAFDEKQKGKGGHAWSHGFLCVSVGSGYVRAEATELSPARMVQEPENMASLLIRESEDAVHSRADPESKRGETQGGEEGIRGGAGVLSTDACTEGEGQGEGPEPQVSQFHVPAAPRLQYGRGSAGAFRASSSVGT